MRVRWMSAPAVPFIRHQSCCEGQQTNLMHLPGVGKHTLWPIKLAFVARPGKVPCQFCKNWKERRTFWKYFQRRTTQNQQITKLRKSNQAVLSKYYWWFGYQQVFGARWKKEHRRHFYLNSQWVSFNDKQYRNRLVESPQETSKEKNENEIRKS